MTRQGVRPMSVFEHHVAHCAIAHQAAIKAARVAGSTGSTREVTDLTVALIQKMHRLDALVAKLGATYVFSTPPTELSEAELRHLFPS